MTEKTTVALEWLTPKQAHAKTGRGLGRIREALHEWDRTRGKSGLRGSQRAAGCTWRIHVADLEAWMRGEKPPSTRGRMRAS